MTGKRLEREFKPPNAAAVVGRISELAAGVEGETLMYYICRGVLAVYERERAHLGSHSATADRLGMHRNTLYDWLEWAREHMTK